MIDSARIIEDEGVVRRPSMIGMARQASTGYAYPITSEDQAQQILVGEPAPEPGAIDVS